MGVLALQIRKAKRDIKQFYFVGGSTYFVVNSVSATLGFAITRTVKRVLQ